MDHVNEEKHDILKPETAFGGTNPSGDDSSRKSDGNESLKPSTSSANTQDRLLKSQIITHGDRSDELVDVSVCDICGDAGREALLALCSTCSDGAEHIYCMRNKLDKVPEKGWMCEECVEMQELKNSEQVVVERAVSPLNTSCSEKFSHCLPKISPGVKQVAKTITKHLGKSFGTSGKRRGPQIETNSAPKKRTFGKNISPPRSLCDGIKTQSTCNSSMSNMHVGKSADLKASSVNDRPAKRTFEQAFSSGNRSPKLEKRFCKGDMSELNVKVQQSKNDVLPCTDTAKENADGKLENIRNKKLFKSLSFAGSAPPCTSNVPSFNISKSKDLKCGSGRDSTKKVDVPEKNNRLHLPSTSSRSMTVHSPRTKVASKTARPVSSSDKTAIQVRGNVKAQTSGALPQDEKKHANSLARLAGKKLSMEHSSDVIMRPVKDLNSPRGNKASHPTQNAEPHSTAKDENRQFVSSGNVLQHELHPVRPMVLSGSSAVPAAECIWKGVFKMVKRGKFPNHCNGIQAHLSTCASSKVHEVVSKFGPKLVLNEAPRLQTWPAQFRSCHHPTEQDIALYFFAEDLQSYGRSYKPLLDGMMEKDLVLEASFDGVQLIVLPSSLLPTASQKWNSLHFLWGVCRVRKVDDHSPHLPGVDVATLNRDIGKSVTCRPSNEHVSTLEAERSSPSQTFQAADALLLLSSVLTKFSDKSRDHDASSVKLLGAQEENDVQPDTIQYVDSLKEEPFLCRALPTDDTLKGIHCDDQDMKHISKTDIFPFEKSYGENTVPLALNSGESRFHYDGICRNPGLRLAYNPTPASRSSISIDSGPCGSSDGGARSSDGEQLERPPNSRGLNLDLRLGSPEEEQIDLDLVLGFPSRYQPRQRTVNANNGDVNLSLALSL
ncbi:hypothetical protein RND81_08G141300 [Saponaria officinalis]